MSEAKPHQEHLVLGMLATSGAWLMFSIMNMCAKYLSTNHSVIEIAFYRNLIALIPFLAMAFVFGRRDIIYARNKPLLVSIRGALGVVSIVATFAAFSKMPMAETSVLLFTASFFLPILGILVLGERVSKFRWGAIIIGFIGIAVMANPSGTINNLGVIFALSAAFVQAVMTVLLRHLGGHEKPETISLHFFIVGTLLTGLAMPWVAVMPSLSELPFFLGVGISGAAAQWLYSTALKHTPAAIVAVINYSSIIWAILFGWLIWNDWPAPIVFAGSAVVIACNAAIVLRETRSNRAKQAAIEKS